MTNTIDSNLSLSSVQKETKTTGNNALGQDAFLKILITQLQHQDPANPMEDTEFISQMATFSELEQMMQMNETLNNLVDTQKSQQLLAYNQLLGKEVDWQKITYDEKNPEAKPTIKSGKSVIQGINFTNDGPIFTLENGVEVTLGEIKELSTTNSENSIVSASLLIGKMVSWKVKDEMNNAIVQSVTKKDGQIYYNLNDEEHTQLTDDQIISIETV